MTAHVTNPLYPGLRPFAIEYALRARVLTDDNAATEIHIYVCAYTIIYGNPPGVVQYRDRSRACPSTCV